jgi:hypothetical protein
VLPGRLDANFDITFQRPNIFPVKSINLCADTISLLRQPQLCDLPLRNCDVETTPEFPQSQTQFQ